MKGEIKKRNKISKNKKNHYPCIAYKIAKCYIIGVKRKTTNILKSGRNRDLKPIRAVVTHLKTFFSLCMAFKEEVKLKLNKAANEYSKLLKADFIIRSPNFKYKEEYILRFHEDNFLHLTGVETRLKAKEFYKKCFENSLLDNDFECESSNELKGKIKEKLKHLINIGNFFDQNLVFQECYKKNRVECKLASSDNRCTLGFIDINEKISVPLTLLNKNQIRKEMQVNDISIFVRPKKEFPVGGSHYLPQD